MHLLADFLYALFLDTSGINLVRNSFSSLKVKIQRLFAITQYVFTKRHIFVQWRQSKHIFIVLGIAENEEKKP